MLQINMIYSKKKLNMKVFNKLFTKPKRFKFTKLAFNSKFC